MNVPAKGGCVLVADSHPEMLRAVRSLLEELFEAVVMVGDEASLLVAIRRLQADLVVVDLSLPVAGTRNIVQRLGELFPGLKVVALGVYSEVEAARSVLSAGAAGYVLKRTAGTDMADAIPAVRRGEAYVSPSVDWRPEK
jgi:DNA-binding NarL/FixJ family response regulator